ncbi:MAG: hypothetical protein ACLPVF_19520 [Acidimicrobiales bacterium]
MDTAKNLQIARAGLTDWIPSGQEGQVQMPLGETIFSPAHGMCIDRLGTPWMVMVELRLQEA